MFFNKISLNSIADVDSAAIQLSLVWDELFPPAPKFDGKKKNILREMVCKLAGFDGGYQQFLAHLKDLPESQSKTIIQSTSLMRASFTNTSLSDSDGVTLSIEIAGVGTIYLQSLIEHFKDLVGNNQPALLYLEGIPIVVISTGSGYVTTHCATKNPLFKLEHFERVVQRSAALGLKVSDFYQSKLISDKFLHHLMFGNVIDNSMLNDLAVKLKVSPSWIINREV